MIVGYLSFSRVGPVFTFVGEGVFSPRGEDDVDTLFEQFVVGLIFLGSLIPSPDGFDAGKRGEVLEPARLIAAYKGDVEPAAEQVIESGGMLRNAQRIVSRQH